MDIRVSGHQVDTGDALRVHVEERLQALAEKYFSRSISAHVTFGQGPHNSFSCDIVAHVMQGVILKGAGQGNEAHPAFDQAADRSETQQRHEIGARRPMLETGGGHERSRSAKRGAQIT